MSALDVTALATLSVCFKANVYGLKSWVDDGWAAGIVRLAMCPSGRHGDRGWQQ